MKIFPLLSHHLCKRIEASKIPKSHFHVSSSTRWRRPKQHTKTLGARQRFLGTAKMGGDTDYSAWSNERLIERVSQLEKELKNKNEKFDFPLSVLPHLLYSVPSQLISPGSNGCVSFGKMSRALFNAFHNSPSIVRSGFPCPV